jgi:hypothetical protein
MRISALLSRSLRLAVHPALLGLSVLYSAVATAATFRADIMDITNPYWILTMASVLLLLPIYDGTFIYVAAGLAGAREPIESSGRSRSRRIIDRVATCFPRLFIGQLLMAAGVFVGSLLILPGIYFGVRAALYRQAIVLGDASPVAAFRESFRRVAGVRFFLVVGCFMAAWVAVEFGLEELLFAQGVGAVSTAAILVPASGLLLSALNALLTVLYLNSKPQRSVDRAGETP